MAHARDLLTRLEAHGAHVVGVVVNRVRTWPAATPTLPTAEEREAWLDQLARAFALENGGAFPARLAADAALAVLDGYAAAVARDTEATAPLLAEAERRGYFVRRIPELPHDVHDLAGLVGIEQGFFANDQELP
jgi:hypothetical protein